MTAINNITIPAGDSKQLAVVVEDAEGGDLAGCTIRYWAGPGPHAPAEERVIEKDTLGSPAGIEITDVEERKFTIHIDSADTDAHGGRVFYHECEIIDSSGNVSTIFTGELVISPTWIRSV